jgi:hypothetical protein
MIHSFTVAFGAKYLTGMVTSVPPYETFSLIKYNILHSSKIYKYHFEGAPEFTPVFSGIRVNRYLVLYVCFVDRCVSFCLFPG